LLLWAYPSPRPRSRQVDSLVPSMSGNKPFSVPLKESCPMAFADPQSVTIATVAQSLPRTSAEPNKGVYKKDDGTVALTVSHSYGKRTRRVMRLDHAKIAADPLQASVNVRLTASVYMVVDTPPGYGYTVAETKQIVDALTAYLTASSGARATQFLGGEN